MPTHDSKQNTLVYGILVLISYALSRSSNIHTQLCSGARDLNFDLSLYICSCSLCASNEGSGETTHSHCKVSPKPSLINKYQKLMNWLI